jgi:hypothetical protein
MKKLSISAIQRIFLVFLFSIMQVALWAQENPAPSGGDNSGSNTTTSQTTTTTTTTWYMQPWAWVLGGAILLLIIIALVRGGSTDREVTRTTVVRDTDPRV